MPLCDRALSDRWESMGFKGDCHHWEELLRIETENRRACGGQRIGRKRYLRSTTGAEKHEAGDMKRDEGEEGGIWKWIGIFAMAAGVMVLICSIVAFITWCWSRRS